MHKHVGSILTSDKAIPFGIVEPLYCAFHTFHIRPLEHVLFRCEAVQVTLIAIVRPCAGTVKEWTKQSPLSTRLSGALELRQPEHSTDGFGIADPAALDHPQRRGKWKHPFLNEFILFRLGCT